MNHLKRSGPAWATVALASLFVSGLACSDSSAPPVIEADTGMTVPVDVMSNVDAVAPSDRGPAIDGGADVGGDVGSPTDGTDVPIVADRLDPLDNSPLSDAFPLIDAPERVDEGVTPDGGPGVDAPALPDLPPADDGAGTGDVRGPTDVTSADAGCAAPALMTTSRTFTGNLATVTLGAGFNPLASALAATCLEAPGGTPTCTGTGSRTLRMQFVRDSTTLKTTLGLTANASFDSGVYSGDASASFYRSSEVRSDSAYLVLDVVVTFDAQTLPSPRLTAETIERLRADPEGFVATCGTDYVSAITRGGVFRAVYAFSSLTTSDVETLQTSFSAGGGSWTAGGTFQRSLERQTSHYRSQLFVMQSGGRLEPVGLTPAQLIEQATRFGAAGADGGAGTLNCATAYPVAVETRPYYQTLNFPIGQRYPNITAQINEFANTANTWDQVRVFRNDLDDRLTRSGRLATTACATDMARYTARRAEIDAFYAAMQAKRDACLEVHYCGATAACLRPLTPPTLLLPRLSDPLRCGPACTDGINSTYESDDRGYCTRCTFTPPAFETYQTDFVDNLAASTCRYMRPGARVSAQLRGYVTHRACSNYVVNGRFTLQTRSGMNSNGCGLTSGCEVSFADSTRGDRRLELFGAPIDVDPLSTPAQATASMFQTWAYGENNTSCGGVRFRDVVVDLCDPDARVPGGCALPP